MCISLGYSATVAAGLLGLAFLLASLVSPRFDKKTRVTFGKLIYGIVCFALLLSFFGTVLGGLWADDSWGRFWGWDPKENGALMIVFWNAVVLHARWAGMVRERGLAGLAVLGNVVTLWSWEGVNQLGVGLHSYGVSEGRLPNDNYRCRNPLFVGGIGFDSSPLLGQRATKQTCSVVGAAFSQSPRSVLRGWLARLVGEVFLGRSRLLPKQIISIEC